MFAFPILCIIFIEKVFGMVITQDTVNSGQILLSGIANGIWVDPEVYWSIYDNEVIAASNVTLTQGSGFYITNNLESSDFSVGNLINYGNISLVNSHENSSNVYSVSALQFSNQGNIYFMNSGWNTSVQIDASFWINSGAVVISGILSQKTLQKVTIGSSSGEINNSGLICLKDQDAVITGAINGSGFIHLVGRSTISVSNNGISNTICLAGPYSMFYYNPGHMRYSIAGFGNRNGIELLEGTLTSYNYNTETGTLTVVVGTNSDSFNIGLGYDVNGFQSWDTGIFYGPVPPAKIPSGCACPIMPPLAPSALPTTS